MNIEFIGAAHEVTGSCHFLTVGEKNILVDCGMEQGPDIYENQEIPVNASSIDYVFITHAHIDHSGLVPLLFRHGFRGQIFATNATTALCEIMLKDSAHIQEFEAEWKNRKARRAGRPEIEPMYEMRDAQEVLKLFVPCDYDKKVTVCDEVTIRFRDAGHLLGSSAIEVWMKEEESEVKMVFSGDLGNGNRPIIKDPDYIEEADYVVIESTYGDRLHSTPPDYATLLADVMRRTFTRGGNLVIPAFSVGRTQELLYFMRKIKEEKLLADLPDFDVYVDSPMAVQATSVFNKSVQDCFDEEAMEMVNQGINPIGFEGLKLSITSDDSKMINFVNKPLVIVSASGMCEAGRIRHHLKHNLWRSESTVLFVGYQVVGTLGHSLLNGATNVKLFGETIEVKAEIINLPGISGHADKDHLIKWLKAFKKQPKKVFVVHGEDGVCDLFAKTVEEEISVPAVAPYSGDKYDLLKEEWVKFGEKKVSEKKKTATKAVSNVFARLLAAGQRLLKVIESNEGLPNKDLAKFADQINALADKWTR